MVVQLFLHANEELTCLSFVDATVIPQRGINRYISFTRIFELEKCDN